VGFCGAGDATVLQRMADRIAHRGPDDEGFLFDADAAVALGFRRLAILDIAGGRQPMTTADGAYSVVFNGQIYNFRELRAELTALGAQFRTDHSDTEVLLHGYRQWGEQLPLHLNGMWAFALYDRVRRCLFLSRDRFGKKPLFWCQRNGSFVFASELTALREHTKVPTRLSQRALRKYFGYGFVPAPLTFFEGVQKLPAGHNLTLDLRDESVRILRYWHYQPEPFDTRPADSEERWTEELTAHLESAVKRRLVADVPVGCFLSGGIDSSVVAALAVRHTGRERLKTFSIGFDEATFDETRYATRCRRCRCNAHWTSCLRSPHAGTNRLPTPHCCRPICCVAMYERKSPWHSAATEPTNCSLATTRSAHCAMPRPTRDSCRDQCTAASPHSPRGCRCRTVT
jgi:asparagine synthase (glutamine-hydrolysing)